jgi:hypothetical protein
MFIMKKETRDKLIRQTLIASTGASMRLSGSKVTDEEVEEILDEIEKRKQKI